MPLCVAEGHALPGLAYLRKVRAGIGRWRPAPPVAVISAEPAGAGPPDFPGGLPEMLAHSPHGALIEAYFRERHGRFIAGALPPRSLVMCFTNRCGSTFVAAEASRHGFCGAPNSHLNFELLNSDFVIEFCSERNLPTFAAYLGCMAARFRSPLGWLFTKASIDQLAWLARIGAIPASPPPVVVHVRRRNLVAQAVSVVIAKQTGQWTSLHPGTAVEPVLDIDAVLEELAYVLRANAAAECYFALSGIEPVRFEYEAVLERPEQVAEALGARLGIAAPLPSAPTLALSRQTTPRNESWESLVRAELRRRHTWLDAEITSADR